ncbi:PA2169 family four-helix-bundle protein [Futiania mangrovi]|uniref:PA2169 family four-helix-bundle protein n=1 Tax=Futiania mangrovi TaxID=2959716 RepID=A0A9J6P933_9PROT|nr:PA2169 family four-helix-bundle protein [Futiania mangrovii]MCP1335245.1 PA2169 family four-helix-bundle protein [Futiania mangrovii]
MSQQTVDVLNQLIHFCYDAMKGYEDAAHAVRTDALNIWLAERVKTRRSAAEDLVREVERLGGTPLSEAAVNAGFFASLKTVVTDGWDAALAEVERCEAQLIEEFTKALQLDIDGGSKDVVRTLLDHFTADQARVSRFSSAA